MCFQRGRMVSINSTDNLAVVIGDPFQPFNWSISNKPLISLPHKDEIDKGGCLQLDSIIFEICALISRFFVEVYLFFLAASL